MRIADLAGAVRAPGQNAVTILVVDDDASVLEIVAEFLEDLGYRVHRASDATAALAMLAATEDVDLLLTDISMPVMSGVELAEQALACYPALKVILMSGYSDPVPRARLVLRKPFSIRKLAETVKAAILTKK